MSLSAYSRRVSGSIVPRVFSVTTCGGQPPALRASYTLSSLDTLLQDDPGSYFPTRTDVLSCARVPDMPRTTRGRRTAVFAGLGRTPPPADRPAIQRECIALNTFRPLSAHAGLLAGLGLRTSTSMNALATPNSFSNSSQPQPAVLLASAQPGPSVQSSFGGSLLPGQAEPDGYAQAQVHALLHTQAQAQTHIQTGARNPRAVSLASLPPLPLSEPLSAEPLAHCAHERINSCDDSAAPPSAPCSLLMPSATPTTRSFSSSSHTTTHKTSAMDLKAAMAPPLPPPVPLQVPDILQPHAEYPSPVLSPVLPCLPSSSALHSPGLAPPAPHPSAFFPESPIAHARRAPSPARTPPMRLHSTPVQHTLTVLLPEGLAPEMVTVSAKKGARLAVVADLWHREHDSHYEWEVVFSPADVDMMSVRAVFEAGQLMIHVRRRPGSEGLPQPLIYSQ